MLKWKFYRNYSQIRTQDPVCWAILEDMEKVWSESQQCGLGGRSVEPLKIPSDWDVSHHTESDKHC